MQFKQVAYPKEKSIFNYLNWKNVSVDFLTLFFTNLIVFNLLLFYVAHGLFSLVDKWQNSFVRPTPICSVFILHYCRQIELDYTK